MASSSKSPDVKDDVDRLFACFKCGVSPPQSALLDRKTRPKRSKNKADGEASGPAGAQSSTSQGLFGTPPDGEIQENLYTSTSMAIKFSRRKQISPIVFYGSPHGVPVKRPLQLLKLLREIHVDLAEQNDFSQRKEIWATFPRQEEAIKFAKTHAQVFVFSYQDHLNGQRRFLASSYDEFWRRYKCMAPKVRHHYEVIQEGFPCHLYFDLEFDKGSNHIKDVDEMVDILLSVTLDALNDKYSIKGKHEWVIELDSSTEEKFSRHLIIRIPGTAFKDNSHVGAFVSEICSRIVDFREGDPQIEKLYIRKKSSTPDSLCQLFLDTAVYTRNRCFRLAYSSKAGKNSFLLPTGRFNCKNMNERQVFMESLICKMDIDCKKLLICKEDLDFKKTLCFDSEFHLTSASHMASKEVGCSHTVTNSIATYFTGKSPFPSLDVFVESIASNGNVSGFANVLFSTVFFKLKNTLSAKKSNSEYQVLRCLRKWVWNHHIPTKVLFFAWQLLHKGKIRSWYWFSMYGLMVYNMLRNRYCERIGREHKSNHDFQRAGYYQKCYDPDCKGYRSPMRPIPSDVIPDGITLFNSTQSEHYREVMNISFDLQANGEDEKCLCTDVEVITESCKKDSGWWQEAIQYADRVENLRKAPGLKHTLEDDWIEDQDWWMDVDKFISQVEEQTG